ncbi:MAG: glycosyltransferase [Iodobacter sp.]
MNKPLVTIVIVSYNHVDFIDESISSVFNQSYKNLEVFVLDNGSVDGSIDVIKNSKFFGEFEFIRNAQCGLIDSLNNLKDKINGKYVCFVAADDFFDPDKINTQVQIMEGNDKIGACSGSMTYVDEKGKKLRNLICPATYLSFEDILLKKLLCPAPVAMIRKAALDDVGWYNSSFVIEDLQMWLKLTSKGWLLFTCPDILGYYRRHGSNISSKTQLMIDDQKKIVSEYSDGKLLEMAIDRINLSHFSLLARSDVPAACRILGTLPFSFANLGLIIKGLILMVVPKFILKRIGID